MLHGLLLELAGHHDARWAHPRRPESDGQPRAAPRGTSGARSGVAACSRPSAAVAVGVAVAAVLGVRLLSSDAADAARPPGDGSARATSDGVAEAGPRKLEGDRDVHLGRRHRARLVVCAAARRGTADARSRRTDLPRGRRRLAESRGGARERDLVEVRRLDARHLLRVRRAARVRPSPARFGGADRQPREQPRRRLRRRRAGLDPRRAARSARRLGRQARRDHLPARQGAPRRVPRLRPVQVGGPPREHPRRGQARPSGRGRTPTSSSSRSTRAPRARPQSTSRRATRRSSARIEARAGRSHTR